MSRVFQPVGQKRLTNVAVVRYKKGGLRFEVACYKNKVVNWRNGMEKDIDEVLQSTSVFTNVSKAILAKEKDLINVFGTSDQEKICLLILEKGDFQVSDKERQLEYTNLFKDVASILVDKCINPETNKPFTISMLERALKDVHFNPDPKRSAKQQALESLPLLQKKFPIERAKMRLQVLAPLSAEMEVLHMLQEQEAEVLAVGRGQEGQPGSGGSDSLSVTCQVEPGGFRRIFTFVKDTLGARGVVQVLSSVQEESQSGSEELQSKSHRQAPAERVQEPAAMSATQSSMERLSCVSQEAGPEARAPASRDGQVRAAAGAPPSGNVIFSRGPVSTLPEEHESRRERFEELDRLQEGWTVELTQRNGSDIVDASFFDPSGQFYSKYADARRAALQFKRQQGS